MLFHISEDPAIAAFVPRPSKYTDPPVVWAVHADKLRNYLLPRDCPRVTYFAGPRTSEADKQRFLGDSGAEAVVAVETLWWPRIRSCRLYCYHLAADTFTCLDECAGYFVSRETVTPARVEAIDDPVTRLLERRVELRILPDLRGLREAVIASTLQFSIIRMPRTLD
jgi:hypothetical protein